MKRFFLALGMSGILFCGMPVQVQASDINADSNVCEQCTAETAVPYADWLITTHTLSCSGSIKAVKITSKTYASSTMAKIGFKDIVIQRSSDEVNWSDEVDVGDMLKSSASTYSLANYSVPVEGGYYYRVSLTHYAKERGLFGKSQSVENVSNSVWVSL